MAQWTCGSNENEFLSFVFLGCVIDVANYNRARPAIFNAPSFVELFPVRREFQRAAHFLPFRSLFIRDELRALPVRGYRLEGIIFRFLNFPPIRVVHELAGSV